ncbi:hypothetical protein BRARA_E01300 [Brassica rapa]|uniref:Uncharacterized protein n=1 Tax=Brassica campestris TaxID=3711 RepID=A0A397ZIK1_BRACM|nr:hypothetical protein BRARA_E01300 [Brassica rapa]
MECNRYYSMYGYVEKLLQEIRKVLLLLMVIDAKLWQNDMYQRRSKKTCSLNEWTAKEFGMMAAQFKVFLDKIGGLWRILQLAGKPAGIFYSTGAQRAGQEPHQHLLRFLRFGVFTCVVIDF